MIVFVDNSQNSLTRRGSPLHFSSQFHGSGNDGVKNG